MSTPMETESKRERNWIYITALVVLGVLVVAGLLAFNSARETRNAEDKADELIAALEDAGARTPDRDQIVRVLGEDGGALCKDPASALGKSILFSQLTNGAAGPGIRPVIADSKVFQGQLLAIQIYCPDELPRFQQLVERLKTAPVAGG